MAALTFFSGLKVNLDLPVTDTIRWKDEKFIDHIEKSISNKIIIH